MSRSKVTKISDLSPDDQAVVRAMDVNAFLEEIKPHPYLYKANVDGYKNVDKKKRAFEAIEEAMELPGKFVVYHSLKECLTFFLVFSWNSRAEIEAVAGRVSERKEKANRTIGVRGFHQEAVAILSSDAIRR